MPIQEIHRHTAVPTHPPTLNCRHRKNQPGRPGTMRCDRKTGSWQVTSAVVMHDISSMHCNAKRFDSQYKRAHLNCNFDHYGWHFLVWHKFFKIPILVTVGFYLTTTATRITMIIRKGNHFEEVVRCLRILFCSPSQNCRCLFQVHFNNLPCKSTPWQKMPIILQQNFTFFSSGITQENWFNYCKLWIMIILYFNILLITFKFFLQIQL